MIRRHITSQHFTRTVSAGVDICGFGRYQQAQQKSPVGTGFWLSTLGNTPTDDGERLRGSDLHDFVFWFWAKPKQNLFVCFAMVF